MNKYTIPVIYKPQIDQMYEYVRDCPGCTSRDIVADLEFAPHAVNLGLIRLLRKGMLRTQGKESGGLKLWFLSDNKPRPKPQHEAKQVTVTRWPAVTCAKQNIFSALGL